MAPPFTAEEFFSVFSRYNEAVWPLQIVLLLLAVASAVIALRRPAGTRLVLGYLAALWAWMGVAYHWAFFSAINPAARIFGGLFVLEAALLLWVAVARDGLVFEPRLDVPGVSGGVLLAYGLVLYPLLGWIVGHRYPAQPTFGLPCPTTIFTMGLLLWVRGRVPWYLLVVPAIWSVVGMSAARFFGVLEDAMLPVAGLVGGGIILVWNRRLSASEGP